MTLYEYWTHLWTLIGHISTPIFKFGAAGVMFMTIIALCSAGYSLLESTFASGYDLQYKLEGLFFLGLVTFASIIFISILLLMLSGWWGI